MKRKSGRKSQNKDESSSNGVEDDLKEQNGDTSDVEDDQPIDKKRKAAKTSSRNASRRAQASDSANSDAVPSDEDLEPIKTKESKEKKKGNKKGKKPAAKEVQEEEGDEDGENETQYEKKKGNKKGKKPAAKEVQEEEGDEDEENETQYEVQAVLDEKKIGGIRHYLIRWKGYEEESDTWEPEDTLDCKELIEEYKEKKKNKTKKSPKKEKKDTEEPKWDENEDFEVERILEVHHRRDGKREFLVSWKGYGSAENSWEPEENMDCKDLIVKFMSKVDKAREVDERELRVNRKQVQRYTLSTQETSRRLSRRFRGRERVQYHDAE